MSYIFPKRLLREKDILDSDELNADFIPAAELYSGKLNAHNALWKQSTVSDPVTPAANALFEYVYERNVANPGMGSASSGAVSFKEPSHLNSTNEVAVPNTVTWDAMETVTITTGVSSLWITGFAQYFWTWWGSEATGVGGALDNNYSSHSFGMKSGLWSGSTTYAASGNSCGVQFAIRVDGQVLEWTITGKHNPFETTVVPYRPKNAISALAAGTLKGATYVKRTTACGPEMYPVRLGSVFPVQAGTHTIEVVARRVPRTSEGFINARDHVYTFNRQLFVLDMPSFPATVASVSTVQPDAFETEDTVSTASLGTDAVDVVRDALNDVQPGAFARGAFMRDHFASPVGFADQNKITTGKTAYNLYPGFSDDTVVTSRHSQEGWYLLDNSAGGNELSVDTSSWNTEDSTVVVVTANISVTKLMLAMQNPYSATHHGNYYRDVVALFQLGYYRSDTSSWVMMQRSQAAVSHQQWWSMNKPKWADADYADGLLEENANEPDRFDVALMAVLDGSTDPAAIANITKIAVFGSCLQMGSDVSQANNDVYYTYSRGSIQVFQLKK